MLQVLLSMNGEIKLLLYTRETYWWTLLERGYQSASGAASIEAAGFS